MILFFSLALAKTLCLINEECEFIVCKDSSIYLFIDMYQILKRIPLCI